MKNKKVSVIIAAYNEEQFIEPCLGSLVTQDYKPLEIIVVDDGSSDNTVKIAKKFTTKVYELRHRGTAVTRNFGASKSRGEILVFLDADMEFPKDFILHLVKPINEGKSKGTFSKLEYVKNWANPWARCWNRNNPRLSDRFRVPQNNGEGEDFRALLKSEFDRVKGFDDIGYTDTWTLAKKLGYKPQDAPDAKYYHNNPESLTEIFEAAQWIGKRKYKLGKIGNIITIARFFVLFSIVKGVLRALRFQELRFILFQVVYDFGIANGAFTSLLFNEVKK